MRGTTLVCVVAFVIGVVAGAEDRATVFLVPHTHCDPGWLDTYQGYYDTEVKFILDTVVEQLAANPSYKFTWAETSFFRLWWETQSDSKKNQFRSLLENGQIEFVMGGWSMADEGIVTHEAVVNDMTEGHLYLFDELGVVPKVAWQIDPFGASDTIAALFKMMGLENEVHMRIDWRLRDEMKIQRTLEFIWNTMGTILLPEQNMFTHILEDQYSGPPGMNWEDDTKPVTLLNVEAFALDFITIARERLAMYRTNNLLMLFGHDFAFQNAAVEFGNMTMIVDWINKHESDYNLTVVYSTPSDYFNTIHSTQVEFPTYEGPDFFPYSQSTNCFHSGYYSSHSCLKIRSRQADRAIRWGDQLLSWVVTDSVAPTNEELSMIQEARRNEALIQHHDSVTGTSREIPTDDDMARLEGAIENCTEFATTFMPQLLLRTISSPTPVLSASPDTLKQIDSTHSGVIILENSLGWDRTTPVSVLVYRSDVTVLDNAGSAVPAQVIPNTDGSYTLWFTASVPALGWSTYFISVGQSGYTEITVPGAAGSSVTLDNGVASFVFSNGFLSSITNYERSLKMIVDQKFLQYTSHKDGAYLFRSFRPAHEIANIAAVQVNFTDGQLVQQIEVSILDDTDTQIIKQTTRLFTGLPYAEAFIEINGNQQIDEELITRFSAVIDEDIGHWFFADSVAYNMHKREWRELYGFEGNYFPSSTTVYVADYTSQLTILTDSSHGSSNVAHGEVELMLHRRLSHDDDPAQGVVEPLNDTCSHNDTFWILMDDPSNTTDAVHQYARQLNNPINFLYGTTTDWKQWTSNYQTSYSPIQALPPNIHLFTLAPRLPAIPPPGFQANTLMLRLEHLYGVGESPQYSKPVEVDLSQLLSGDSHQIPIDKLQECSLSMNACTALSSTIITIDPKQIRSFLVTFA